MTAGNFPNQGRITRGSSNWSRGVRGKRRIGTLYPTALGDEQYTNTAVTANKLLIDYFWAELTVNGTLALTEAADTNSASGTTTVVGTLALTEQADTNSASGTAGSGSVDGTLALTEAADTNSASGTTTVVGSSALTEAADTNAASGTTTVRGTLALTEAADSFSFAGDAGAPEATPTVALAGGSPEFLRPPKRDVDALNEELAALLIAVLELA